MSEQTMEWEETKTLARKVIADAEAAFSREFTENAKELIAVNEWKVGMECLCDNLHEVPRPLPKALMEDLKTVARALGISPAYWDKLRSE